MKRGKAQYSLEFLVTYGWALLIIGIVLAAIYTFGWIDTSNFLPQRCTFYGQTGCQDFYLSETELNLSLVNNYGVPLNITAIEFRIEGDVICGKKFDSHIQWNRSRFAIVPLNFQTDNCETDRIRRGSRVIGIAIVEFFSPSTCVAGSFSCRHNTTGTFVTRVQ